MERVCEFQTSGRNKWDFFSSHEENSKRHPETRKKKEKEKETY